MAWNGTFTFLPTRTTADSNSSADMNQEDINVEQLWENIKVITGNGTSAPTDDMEGLNTRVAAIEAGGIHTFRGGMEMSNAADTDHDITVSAGSCSASDNTYALILAAAMTKQIDVGWAAGTNAGGLFSGAVGNNTWYAVHIIRKDADGSIDVGFDTSKTAANIPAGYTKYRRIGWVLTDGSANIRGFIQYRSRIYWKSPVLDVDSDIDQAAKNFALTQVPTGQRCAIGINVHIELGGVDAYAYISCPDLTDLAPAADAAPIASVSERDTVKTQYIETLTDASQQIRARGSHDDIVFDASVVWYEDSEI